MISPGIKAWLTMFKPKELLQDWVKELDLHVQGSLISSLRGNDASNGECGELI